MQTDDYFLSATNPIANVDQRDLETLALRIFQRPEIKAARERAAIMFRRVTDRLYPAEQMARMEQCVAEYCMKSIMVAAASDANYPRVLRVYTQGAHWLGHRMHGSRWGGDNPDNAYRVIGMAAGGEYEVRGQRQKSPSTYVTFQLVANSSTSVTMGSLEQLDMEIDADGAYVLTLDSAPAGGRRNHLQIPQGTMYLFIRDSMGDWETQHPDALRVRRRNAPTRGPLTEDEITAIAVGNIHADVFYHYYAARLFFNGPQTMTAPEGAGPVGGLVTQMGSLGHFTLADDEAAILTANEGGATYRNVVLHDLWLLSLDNCRLTSLTNAQMKPDADGRHTYVVSIRDPGVHNWLDTTGLHDVLILHRWQGFRDPKAAQPAIEARKVKLAELDRHLPDGVARVTSTERHAQLAARKAAFERRYADV
ncbi:MAG: hypothetical protein AB7Q97_19965 [Gammaproteobacteria bacterium]